MNPHRHVIQRNPSGRLGAGSAGPLEAYGFSRQAFEHLLFPLHGLVYRGLKRAFLDFAFENPEGARALLEVGQAMAGCPTDQGIRITPIQAHHAPHFDIRIDITTRSLDALHRSTSYKTLYVDHAYFGVNGRPLPCQLIVKVHCGDDSETYMVPLAYVMKGMERRVCRPGAYQLYRHGLIEQTDRSSCIASLTDAQRELHSYIGITRRSWQRRYAEHRNAANRGSHLRFHRALRGELFPLHHREHEIVRAGLTEDQALTLEEHEVELHSLAPMPGGLNMIPGGRAGIRYLRAATGKDDRRLRDADRIESVLEDCVAANLRQGDEQGGELSKLAELWRTDLQYRIKAMTTQHNRISYAEIRAARVYHASGWALEKIRDRLNTLRDGHQRMLSEAQVQHLVSGRTYSTIPHVMVDDV